MRLLHLAGVALLAAGIAAPALAARLDTNNDGRVTLAEMQAHKVAHLMKADANRDGRLSRDEYASVGHKRRAGAEGEARAPKARKFDKLDLNHDGFLTPNEISQSVNKRFAKLDRDRDGAVPVAELHAKSR